MASTTHRDEVKQHREDGGHQGDTTKQTFQTETNREEADAGSKTIQFT